MLYDLGYEVKRLMRIRIGPVELGSLKPGHWRQLKQKEVDQLSGKSGKTPARGAKSRPK
jgi:23S rRNA pseudouridine2605 synthase